MNNSKNKLKKIYILGHCGSGTTHLSKILSSNLKIPSYDMDDVRFIKKFTKTRTKPQRKKLVDKILKNKDWIIDARGTDWDRHAMLKADLIIWLRTSFYKRVFRIFKRYFKRRKNPKFSEKFFEQFTIILYTLSFRFSQKATGFSLLKRYLEKNKLQPIIIKTNRDLKKFLN